MYFSTLISNLNDSTNVLTKLGHSILNFNSLVILAICLLVGIIVANIAASLVQKLSLLFGHRADKSSDLGVVTFMRRIETFLVLSQALIRLIIIILSLYVWWLLTHAGEQPSALIGASALALVIAYGLSGPLLRDIAFGGSMMAEQWFGVGDVVNLQPNNIHGIVERITLRSTKIRGFSGETIWYSNQNINMVSVMRKGTWTIALELFVEDVKRAEKLVEDTNRLLPQGPSLVISPLKISNLKDEGAGVKHITLTAETAPGRDYLISENAINIMTNLDKKNKKKILLVDIVAHFDDKNTEVQLARAIQNARKVKRSKRPRSINNKVIDSVKNKLDNK